jgi:Putative MetA-pathway of phenol degradation
MKKIFLITLFTSFSINLFAGGPWVPGNKKAYVQAGWSGLFYNKVMIDGKTTETGKSNYDFTYQIYSEIGLGDRGLMKVILPFKQLGFVGMNGTSPNGSLSGLGNVTFGGKYLIADKNIKLSAGVDVQTGTTKRDDALGLRTGYESTTILPYISIGSGFKKSYLSADLGYGLMSNGYSSFLKINAEAGYKVSKKLYTILMVDIKNPNKKGSFGEGLATEKKYLSNGAYVNNQSFMGLGIKLNYEIKENKFGINASALGALGLDNVAMTPSFNGGLYIKL